MLDDTHDAFELPATAWPLSAAPLRLWCKFNPVEAISDALDIASWPDIDGAVVVEDDLAGMLMPVKLFRRLTTPYEATVCDPSGNCLSHCEAVEAKALIAMLLAFASEAYTQAAEAAP
jgi:hypothetical protein